MIINENSVLQTIVYVKGTDLKVLLKASVKAGMEIKDQFDPDSPNFSGQFEKAVFKNDSKKWASTGFNQHIIEVDSLDDITFLEMQANMEALAVNYIETDNDTATTPVLVIGPCTGEKVLHIIKPYM